MMAPVVFWLKRAPWLLLLLVPLIFAMSCATGKAIKTGAIGEREVLADKESARELFKEGARTLYDDPKGAQEKFLEAYRLDPELFAALYNAGLAAELAKDYGAAQRNYQACLDIKSDAENCLYNLILVLFQNGAKDEAEALVQRYLTEKPDEPYSQAAAATLALLKNDLNSLEKHAKAALERDSDNIQALYLMARFFYEKKQYAAARWVLDNALKIAPAHGAMLLWQGHTFLKLDLPLDALESYEKAVKAEPVPEALESYGLLLLQRGQVPKALKMLEKAQDAVPNSAPLALNVGNAYMASKSVEEARKSYERALVLDPALVEANFNLGLLYFDGKFKDLPEPERLSRAQFNFQQYAKQQALPAEKKKEVDAYLKIIAGKIEAEKAAEEAAKEIPPVEEEAPKAVEEAPGPTGAPAEEPILKPEGESAVPPLEKGPEEGVEGTPAEGTLPTPPAEVGEQPEEEPSKIKETKKKKKKKEKKMPKDEDYWDEENRDEDWFEEEEDFFEEE